MDFPADAFPAYPCALIGRGKPVGLFALACVAGVLTSVEVSAATTPFPRGTGFYYDPVKFAMLVLSFLGWVKLCAWVDYDADRYKIRAVFWNSMLLLAGLGGLWALWNLANFWFAWFLFLLIVGGATAWYLTVRNRRADEYDQLFNRAYFMRLYSRLRGGRRKARKAKGAFYPVRFLSRNTAGDIAGTEGDERVQQSKGYKVAVELVWSAVQKRATDIHLEPSPSEVVVRFRIDGIMTNIKTLSRAVGEGVVNIFKVICNLDITEKRKPQDGGFSAQVETRLVEFRIATAGSVAGEKLVMRILDTSAQVIDLSQIGMAEPIQVTIREVITRPNGLFLVCGPTGSGKSTTLYACLQEINRFQQNIITVENPVEYRLDNVTQIEINPKAGKTFATELRSILRQDPDVIFVGEIRDKETAEIACQAAQTGHLVFTTVHANDSITAIARLIDLGVPPFMLSTAVIAVLAQRLVRKLCKKCRKRVKPSTDTLKKMKIDPDLVRYLYRAYDREEDAANAEDENDEESPPVCEACGGMGYFKRTGIFEMLIINDRIRELIRENPNVHEIRRVALESGLHTLFDDGSRLVIDGETSIQELLRVCK